MVLNNGVFMIPRIFLCVLLFFFYAPSAFAADYFHAFIYHRFGDSRYPTTNISIAEFSEQMRYLRDHGYHVVRAGAAVDLLRQKKAIPAKTVILTVDDAYATFKSGALPILRQYGFPVTLFVNTDSVGTKGYLTWSDLRALEKEGVEIGNHTATHRSMTEQLRGESEVNYRQRLRADLDRTQQALKKELGFIPELFAYPFGEYSLTAQKIVTEAGFKAAFGQHSGVIGVNDPLFSLPRTPLTGSFATLDQMEQKLALRPLPIRVISPDDTLIEAENPPTLIAEILDPLLDPKTLHLFVNGEPGGTVQIDPRNGRRIIVKASKVLGAGRNRYILTARGREAGTFYSFTQFWLNRSRP